MTDLPAPDAPEADVLEQRQPADAPTVPDEDEEEAVSPTEPRIGIDVPEADAIEQAQTVPLDEDDEPR